MTDTERMDIGFLIKRISDRVKTHADASLRRFDLTFSQMRVLHCIDSCGGMATQKQIEEALDVTHPVSLAARQMKRTGGTKRSGSSPRPMPSSRRSDRTGCGAKRC